MDIVQAIILGIVQGLTEFIPVSSSGHLQFIPSLLGWSIPSTSFILFTHIGTLLALLIFFRADLWHYIKVVLASLKNVFTRPVKSKHSKNNQKEIQLLVKILLATIPVGIVGLLAENLIDSFYGNLELGQLPTLITALSMGIIGFLFIVSDKWHRSHKRGLNDTRWRDAIAVGLFQILALVRGVSRSGITILVGQSMGLSRVAAAKFSFLVSIPILAGTSLFAVVGLLNSTDFSQNLVMANMAGLAAAFVSGWWAIKFLLGYLQKNGLSSFGWYRIGVAVLVILVLAV